MASTLKDLLDLKGVAAAGEFSRDGSLVDFEASVDFPQDLAETTAQFTAAVTQLFDVLAGSFTKLNEQFAFTPQQGWAYSGGDCPWRSEAPAACSSRRPTPTTTNCSPNS